MCMCLLCRAIMSLVGLGSVSEYLLEHAELATAVVRQGTAPLPQVPAATNILRFGV